MRCQTAVVGGVEVRCQLQLGCLAVRLGDTCIPVGTVHGSQAIFVTVAPLACPCSLSQIREENDWKNDLVMWMFPEDLRAKMPRFLQVWKTREFGKDTGANSGGASCY